MKLKNLLMSICVCLMLGSCEETMSSKPSNISNSTTSMTTISSSENSSSSSRQKSSSNKISHLSTDELMAGSCGGSLIEIGAERILAVGDTYTCTFVPSDFLNKDIYLKSTIENIIQIDQLKEGGNTFIITPLNVGETVLKIYTVEDDCLVYRNVIRVGKTYSETEILDYVYDKVDIWKSTGIYGTYKMTFVTEKPLNGTLSGYDDYENTYIQFRADYIGKEKLYDFSFYVFDLVLDDDNSETDKKFTDMYISVTGDNILVYYDEGLLDMFVAM